MTLCNYYSRMMRGGWESMGKNGCKVAELQKVDLVMLAPSFGYSFQALTTLKTSELRSMYLMLACEDSAQVA
jgi:hypothetical protein